MHFGEVQVLRGEVLGIIALVPVFELRKCVRVCALCMCVYDLRQVQVLRGEILGIIALVPGKYALL